MGLLGGWVKQTFAGRDAKYGGARPHIARHHSTGANGSAMADGHAGQDGRTSPNEDVIAYAHTAAERSARSDMNSRSKLAFMIDAGASVDDATDAEHGAGRNARPHQDLTAIAEPSRSGDARSRMDNNRAGQPAAGEKPEEPAAIRPAPTSDGDGAGDADD